MAKVNMKESTKINWVVETSSGDDYPGDKNIELGCLMRIADATEKMASNYQKMENDLAMYKRWYGQEVESVKRLTRSNNALRGYLNRLKKLS
jgi:hypothetical protein